MAKQKRQAAKAGLLGPPIRQPARAGFVPRSIPPAGRTDVKPYAEDWNKIPAVHDHAGSLSVKKTPASRRR